MLASLNFCQEPGVLYVFMLLEYAIYILKILVPIILIITGSITFFKGVIKSDDLKGQLPVFMKKLVAALVIFLAPTFISFIFDTLVEFSATAEKFSACFENANVSTINALKVAKTEDAKNSRDEQIDQAQNGIITPPDKVIISGENDNDSEDDTQSEQSPSSNEPAYGNLLVGDSRTAGYSYQINLQATDKIFATSGGTMSHFKSDVAKAINVINSDSAHRYNLVLNYGVNNLSDDYVSAYREVINQVGDKANVLIVSVNPCNDNIAKYCRNANIETFNRKIKSEFSTGYANVKYCDTYTQFINQPNYINMIETQEGIHYTSQGSQFIYNRINECLSNF